MSGQAAELRAAAKLMRERAQAVPQDWRLIRTQIVGDEHGVNVIATCMVRERAAYVASWHPAVALAIAGWLDETADGYDRYSAIASGAAGFVAGDAGGDPDPALMVARAYLGEVPR